MQKKIIMFVAVFLNSLMALVAQTITPNCTPVNPYLQMHDGTGTIPFTAGQAAGLNTEAIELATHFPEPYCSAFKVYDYGFTPMSQYTKGGYAAPQGWCTVRLRQRNTRQAGGFLRCVS